MVEGAFARQEGSGSAWLDRVAKLRLLRAGPSRVIQIGQVASFFVRPHELLGLFAGAIRPQQHRARRICDVRLKASKAGRIRVN